MSKTIENLTKAFIGESQARNRYTMYSKIAKKEGYEQISTVFTETAEQEAEHGKWLFRLINQLQEKSGATVVVEAEAPTVLSTTEENLKSAIAGENHEYTSMYPEFADIAESEGYLEIAVRLRAIAQAEAHHEERFQKLLTGLETDTLFTKEKETVWICRKCGYAHTGKKAPKECPSCGHPTAYFQVQSENY
jgi:rubrerythrin